MYKYVSIKYISIMVFIIFVIFIIFINLNLIGNKKGFKTTYYDRYLSWTPNTNDEIMRENLFIFTKILEEENIFYWLSEGTALGSIREGNIIKNDSDVDIGIYYKDKIKIENCIKKINKHGFKIMRFYDEYPSLGGKLNIVSFHRKNHYIDIDFTEKGKCCVAVNYPRKCDEIVDVLEPFQKTKIGKKYFTTPSIEYLELLYGKEWMIPKEGFKPDNIRRC